MLWIALIIIPLASAVLFSQDITATLRADGVVETAKNASTDDLLQDSGTQVTLRLLQFNTLAKHLAETFLFPYAIDVEREEQVDRHGAYESWEKYGVQKNSWRYNALNPKDQEGKPSDFLLRRNERGTFGVEKSDGKYIYSWSERRKQLVEQIVSNDPDLIFLQEVEAGTVPEFEEKLGARIRTCPLQKPAPMEASPEHKYEGVFVPRRADTATSDGVALLWKRGTLQPGKECEVLRYSDGQKLALLQPLQVKRTGSSFLAVTTHLHWNPAKSLQQVEVEELIKTLDSLGRPLPVILGGDLNCGMQNEAYEMLPKAGFQDIDGELPESLQKKFTMHVPRAPVPKLTNATKWDQPSITVHHPVVSDYVLVRNLQVSSVELLDTKRIGFTPSATNGLPNTDWSASDHFPIAYKITAKF
mmetsp:Transcript_109533/g.210654  ORF Transcript_109533/g.210654 Transcript_109533/m.210654 type:complete len:416 (-) Transcript_109533:22-1269(-)